MALSAEEERELVQAVTDGSVDGVRKFLGRDFDINAIRYEHVDEEADAQYTYNTLPFRTYTYTLLHMAVHSKRTEVTRALLQYPLLDPNGKGLGLGFRHTGTPLHAAVCGQDLEMVRALLDDYRVDPNIPDASTENALHLAALEAPIEYVRALIANPRIDVNYRDGSGWSALHNAVLPGLLRGCLSAAKVLLNDRRVDTALADENGSTAFDFLLVSDGFEDDPIEWDEARISCLDLFMERESNRLQRELSQQKTTLKLGFCKSGLLEEDVIDLHLAELLKIQQSILSPPTIDTFRDCAVKEQHRQVVKDIMERVKDFVSKHGNPREFNFPDEDWEPKLIEG